MARTRKPAASGNIHHALNYIAGFSAKEMASDIAHQKRKTSAGAKKQRFKRFSLLIDKRDMEVLRIVEKRTGVRLSEQIRRAISAYAVVGLEQEINRRIINVRSVRAQ